MTTVAPNVTLKRRLEAKAVSTPSGCIEYAGYICKSTGYGKIANRPGPPIGAHITKPLLPLMLVPKRAMQV